MTFFVASCIMAVASWPDQFFINIVTMPTLPHPFLLQVILLHLSLFSVNLTSNWLAKYGLTTQNPLATALCIALSCITFLYWIQGWYWRCNWSPAGSCGTKLLFCDARIDDDSEVFLLNSAVNVDQILKDLNFPPWPFPPCYQLTVRHSLGLALREIVIHFSLEDLRRVNEYEAFSIYTVEK